MRVGDALEPEPARLHGASHRALQRAPEVDVVGACRSVARDGFVDVEQGVRCLRVVGASRVECEVDEGDRDVDGCK